jgi:DNA repair protein RadC
MDIDKIPDNTLREEFHRRFFVKPGEHIGGVNEAAEHFRSLFANCNRDQEHFAVVYLNQQNQVLTSDVLFSGSLSSSAVYPRELIKLVLQHEAGAVLIGHTHPSGSLSPSSSDRSITKKLQLALESIDVALLDHLVIGNGKEGYFSFSDHNLL